MTDNYYLAVYERVPLGDLDVADLSKTERLRGEDLVFLVTDEALNERYLDFCHFLSSLLDRLGSDAAFKSDLLQGAERSESVERRLYDVYGIVGAKRLCTDIAYSRDLEHCTHRTACYNTGTGSSRLKKHLACAVLTDNLVRDGSTIYGNRDYILLRCLESLLNGIGNLGSLAETVSDSAVAVTDYDKRGESGNTSALNSLGYALSAYQCFFEFVVCVVNSVVSHHILLKLQTGFAGAVRKGSDSAVVKIAASVEHNLGDVLLERSLGDKLADLLRGVLIAA